jgi:acid phosphatase family membrane protein YuiD
MYLGDQGRYLNMLIQSLELDPEKYPRLKERVGHRVPEVIVGLVYGIILSIGLMWIIGKIY